MKKFYLQDFNKHEDIAALDTVTNNIVFEKKEEHQKIVGYAAKLGDAQNDIAAVYVESDNLFFQYDKTRWNLTAEEIDIKYHKFLFYEFLKIKKDKKTVFSKRIKSYEILKSSLIGDMDSLDQENSYFLLWLTKSLKKEGWVERVINNWKDGM